MKQTCEIRSPVCTVVGHVDHGKSSILDALRGSAIVATEAGKITQAIGASIIPLDLVKKICGDLLTKLNLKFTIPGLLFIDTPGHAAFTNLRKRGGNLADIAILVVDMNEGFRPQTIESLEILKHGKTPFIVAANKLDLLPGWQSGKGNLLKNIQSQALPIQQELDTKLYELVGKFHEHGFSAERFDRVTDYTKQIAIIPTSAQTKEGLPELLMVLTGLAQRFLEECLTCDTDSHAKGTILEVKEEPGLGTTLDVIIYDGHLSVGDTIIIAGLDQPIVTKIRALLEPNPLDEMRDKKAKFKPVKVVCAATGVKIAAPELDKAIPGMPIRSCMPDKVDEVSEDIQQEVQEVIVETDEEGIIIKADTIGSLEALSTLLKEHNITIRKASVGDISKKDIADAESNEDPMRNVILGFNVKTEATKETVKIITHEVIYSIIDDYEAWLSKEKKALEAKEMEGLTRPCKFELMKGYVFRQSNPAVMGSDVLEGTLKVGTQVMNREGKIIASVKSIQADQETLHEVGKDKQVAVALDGATVGRQVNEGDILYVYIPEDDFRKLKEFKQFLSKEDIEIMKEVALMMRKNNPVWGI